jgi:hypothetical protein
MTEATKAKKQTVVFTKRLEIVARRRKPDEDGKRVDETVYIHLNRMDDLRQLRTSFVKPMAAAVDQLYEIPNYPVNDQLFLYLAEQMKIAQIVDLPEDGEAPEIENSSEEQETEETEDPEETNDDD